VSPELMLSTEATHPSHRLSGERRRRCESQGAIVRDGTHLPLKRLPSLSRGGQRMHAFLRRFLMHYGIYRRYPLGLLPALRTKAQTIDPAPRPGPVGTLFAAPAMTTQPTGAPQDSQVCRVAPSPPVPSPGVGGPPTSRSLERLLAGRRAGAWTPVAVASCAGRV
jgi:hypothetical protein